MIGSEHSVIRMAVRSAALAASVLLACVLVRFARLDGLLEVVLPALVAFLGGMVVLRHAMQAAAINRQQAVQDAVQGAADRAADRMIKLDHAASALRHDLRGILSPALLTADRLAMSQDPVARRAGEAMISTVERAEARLAKQA